MKNALVCTQTKAFFSRVFQLSVRILLAIAEETVGHAALNRLFGRTAFFGHESVDKIECGGRCHTEKKEGKGMVFSFFKAHIKLLSTRLFDSFRYRAKNMRRAKGYFPIISGILSTES